MNRSKQLPALTNNLLMESTKTKIIQERTTAWTTGNLTNNK